MSNLIESNLLELGFSPKEAKVYLALLEIGASSATQIARKAGINRTTVYDVVGALINMGTVTKVIGGKKEIFDAVSPAKLPRILQSRAYKLQEKAQRAQSLLPELNLIASKRPGKPHIKLFEGAEGIKELYEDTLYSTEPIRSFSSAQSLESFDTTYLHNYYKKRAQNKIFIKAILENSPSSWEYKAQDKELYREIRIVPKEMMSVKPETYIYENKVAFFSLKEQFAMLVESYDIANALKKLYDLSWSRAGELEKDLAEHTHERKSRK